MPSPRKKTPAGTRRSASKTVPTGIAGRTRSRSRTRQAVEQEDPVPVPVVKPGRTPARRVAKATTKSPKKIPPKTTTIKFSPIRTRRVVARQELLKNQETEEEEESSVVLEEEAPVSLHDILNQCEESEDTEMVDASEHEQETPIPAFGPNVIMDQAVVRKRPQRFSQQIHNQIQAEHPKLVGKSPQLILQEDNGQNAQDEPTGVVSRNKIIVNVPVKARLKSFADFLGIGTKSIVLHAGIFMVSFLVINLLSTYFFPSTEDDRVNYFYEILTRQDTGSFLVHLKHTERWLRLPQLSSELVALFVTVLSSSCIAKHTRPENPKKTSAVKLFKLC